MMKRTRHSWLLSAIASVLLAGPAHSKILISEVLYDAPNNDTTEEFVELYNDSCSAVSLSGYSLSDNGGSFNGRYERI